MKRATKVVLLVVFLISELFLLTAVLPERSQLALQSKLTWGSDNSLVTHPALNSEIDEVMRQHPAVRATMILCLTLMLVANTCVLVFLWRRLRRAA